MWNLATGLTGWIRYLLQSALYGFMYQVGQDRAEAAKPGDGERKVSILLLVIAAVLMVLTLLGQEAP